MVSLVLFITFTSQLIGQNAAAKPTWIPHCPLFSLFVFENFLEISPSPLGEQCYSDDFMKYLSLCIPLKKSFFSRFIELNSLNTWPRIDKQCIVYPLLTPKINLHLYCKVNKTTNRYKVWAIIFFHITFVISSVVQLIGFRTMTTEAKLVSNMTIPELSLDT